MQDSIIQKAERYVKELFEQKLAQKYKFHDIEHTEHVVKMADEIGRAVNLKNEELEMVMLASWFHDSGYSEKYIGHEEISSRIAFEFLKKNDYPETKILKVQQIIMATKMPQCPNNLLEEVLCDADLAHLGKKNFFKFNNRLRDELKEEQIIKRVRKNDWLRYNIAFLESHEFHTSYAQNLFGAKKKKNIKTLKKMIEERKSKNGNDKKDKRTKIKKQSKSTKIPTDRSVQTMFRNNLRGHLNLSGIADNKANIMLSVNAIIISLILPSAIEIFSGDQQFLIPVMLLIITCVLTIIFATLSTLPNVNKGRTTREDIEKKQSNLLFFGNFHDLNYEDFEYGINQMINDKDFLYRSMTKDFYNLGQVLYKKYKYLSLCYIAFMTGLIITVLSFFILYF
jgi:predicted metal-dependent HD superfamily phosphohydrolase